MALIPSPRASRSVQRILDAAAQLFGRDGYLGASMTDVARAAGVSKGLLHYHFRSKEHLLIEAQRATFRHIHRRFDERFRRGERGPQTALEALDALWDAVYEMRQQAPFMVETLNLATHDGPVRAHLADFYAETDDLLERGIRQVLGPAASPPPERLARMVRALLHGLMVELSQAREPGDFERVRQTWRDLRDVLERSAFEADSKSKESA